MSERSYKKLIATILLLLIAITLPVGCQTKVVVKNTKHKNANKVEVI